MNNGQPSENFIQALLRPFRISLKNVDMSKIRNWISTYLVGTLQEVANERIDDLEDEAAEIANNTVKPHSVIHRDSYNININDDIVNIMEGTIESILESIVTNDNDDIIPWDIIKAINNDQDLKDTIKFTWSAGLPVEIYTDEESLEHLLDTDFIEGLSFFIYTAKINIHITIFGVSFSSHHFDPRTIRNLFIREPKGPYYKISVGKIDHVFADKRFLQGFLTGALWLDRDSKDFYDRLIYFDGKQNTDMDF